MRALLLGLAATVAAIGMAGPAQGQSTGDVFVGYPDAKPNPGFAVSGGVQVGVGSGLGDHRFDRRHRRGDGNLGIWVNGGEWARYNNPSFQSDSYNDWWHDQPWRSQPAWVRNNSSCRAYWSGGGWRC